MKEIETGVGVPEGQERREIPILNDVEVLAVEVLANRKLLAAFLELGERPKTAGELVKSAVWVKWEEGGQVKVGSRPPPKSTMFRLLGRLEESGLVAPYRGIDYRRRYYKLTQLGGEVLGRVLAVVKRMLRGVMRDASGHRVLSQYNGYRYLEAGEFNRVVVEKLGVNPELLARLLGAVRRRVGDTHFILIDYGEGG